MTPATLDQFMALNEQLAALAVAGVPLDLGLGQSKSEIPIALERASAVVARRVSQGASVAEALREEDPALPAAYRCLMQVGQETGEIGMLLQGQARLARSVSDSNRTVRSAMFYPLLIGTLAFAGLVAACYFLVPILSNSFTSLDAPAGFGLEFLEALRDSMPIWGTAIPIIFALWFIGRWMQRGRSPNARTLAWLPGVSRTMQLERTANFAESLAALLESGIALPTALYTAAGASGDRGLAMAAKELSADLVAERPLGSLTSLRKFPAFLRWVLSDPSLDDRASLLRTAGGMYRDWATQRSERMQMLAPIFGIVVLGGGVTLVYALVLFVPLVELLRGVAK